MFEQLNKYIQSNIKMTDIEIEQFNSAFELISVPKKTFLLREGDVCTSEIFIVKGCIKSYFIDTNGFETILTFGTENWWVSDIASFNSQKPSKMFIETIEDCELLMISFQSKEDCLKEIPQLERMYRLLIQRHLTSYQERLFSNIAYSAEERYDMFLEKYPHLPQRIPQHLIASYIGISPEFLSRIRHKKTKR